MVIHGVVLHIGGFYNKVELLNGQSVTNGVFVTYVLCEQETTFLLFFPLKAELVRKHTLAGLGDRTIWMVKYIMVLRH